MSETFQLEGKRGTLVVHHWPRATPRYVTLLAHGYGEHAGRYAALADRLGADGAEVYAPDHFGHGRSAGERALVDDLDAMVADLQRVAVRAGTAHPGLPRALIGHSMGAVIAARYAQLHGAELAALVLSAPPLGGNGGLEALLAVDPIPEVPIDPAILSRDPAVGEAYAADPLVYHGPFTRPTLQGLLTGVQSVAQGEPIADTPTLWIHGEEDELAPLELARPVIERLGGERLTGKVYEGARHEIFNETNRDEVFDDVIAFLRDVLPGGRGSVPPATEHGPAATEHGPAGD